MFFFLLPAMVLCMIGDMNEVLAAERSKMQKHITIYGSSNLLETHLEEISRNYEIVITESWKHEAVKQLKSLNPGMKVLFYRDLIGMRPDYQDFPLAGKHPEWFVRDMKTGNRVRQKNFNWYLMDITNRDFRLHLISLIKTKLLQYPCFDGVFLDDVQKAIPTGHFYSEGSFKDEIPTLDPVLLSSYRDSLVMLIRDLKKELGDKLVFINTNDGSDIVAAADGVMFEGFVHGSWQTREHKAGLKEWSDDIDKLSAYIQTDRYVLVHSGVKGDLRDNEDIFLFTLASYLLLSGPKTTFSFDAADSKKRLPGNENHLTALGQPLEKMMTYPAEPQLKTPRKRSDVYMRQFEHGIAIVNPNGFKMTCEVPAGFEISGYNPGRNLEMNARTGIVAARRKPGTP
jgi:hypothetical protein